MTNKKYCDYHGTSIGVLGCMMELQLALETQFERINILSPFSVRI